MDNYLLQIKVKQRLNKLASSDYDNLECWQIAEAFNKAQLEFCRRQIHGVNQKQEGDESSKMLIDDMQKLLILNQSLVPVPILASNKFQEAELPSRYLYFKRVSAKSLPIDGGPCKGCTGADQRTMNIHLEEVADVGELLSSELSWPSIEWNETFCTLASNKVQIYTNGFFEVENILLSYYRKPLEVEINKCINPSDDSIFTEDVECEFKDDIVEMIIDEAVSILAGDIELFNTATRTKQNAVTNN